MNEKTKKKTKIIVLIAIIALLGILSAIVVPFAIDFHSDVESIKSLMFYTEDTEPKSIGDWIDLCKYTSNMYNDTTFKTSYETDIEKYTKPAWEYLLEKNQNLNDNYHAQLKFRDNGWWFTFDISVDGNVAKVILDMCVEELEESEGKDPISNNSSQIYKKQYEYYMILEDNVVTSYYQTEDGKWIKTTRTPISDGCVAFDLDGMLKAVSELEPYGLPFNDSGWDYPTKPEEYGSVGMRSKTENWIYDPSGYGFEDMHGVVFANFSNCPDYYHKFSDIFRNPFHIAQFVEEETDWAGEDAFLDWLCEIDNTFTMVSIRMFEEDYGNVKIELPEGIESAEMVDDFQFMVTDMKQSLVQHFEKIKSME